MTATSLPVYGIRTDGGTQPRAMLDAAVAMEYAEDMKAGAVFPPVVVFFDGEHYWLADGFHRHMAAGIAGFETIAADVRQGTLEDAQWYSYSVNQTHGKRRTNEDKRRAVEAALQHRNASKYSNRQIAQYCGVSLDMVNRLRHELASERNVQIEPERTVTRNGTTYTMNTANIGRLAPTEAQPAIEWAVAPEPTPAPQVAPAPLPHVAYNAGNNEWYTPKPYIDAARVVLGRIDLDPASTPEANAIVQADTFYTAEQDGLKQEWRGTVWMNPPYSSGLIDRFVDRLCRFHRDAHVSAAIVLVNNATETAWFQQLTRLATAVCFPAGRVNFWAPDGRISQPLQGQAVVYLGIWPGRFRSAFSHFGWTASLKVSS